MKFIFIADHKESRPSFFSLWEVIAFMIIASCVLIMLFPQHLLEKTLSYHQPSPVILSYLQAFKKEYPQNQQIMVALIGQAIDLGRFQTVAENISYYKTINTSPAAVAKNQYQWFDYLTWRYKTYQQTIPSTRIEDLRQLRQMAKTLAQKPLTTQQLKTLAKDNLGLHQPDIALKIYNQLFDQHELKTSSDLATGGDIAMQNSAQQDSAKFYWAAYQKATLFQERKQTAFLAIKALWAGNQVDKALALALKLPNSMLKERHSLIFLSKLALAANHPKLAQDYIVRALITAPNHDLTSGNHDHPSAEAASLNKTLPGANSHAR